MIITFSIDSTLASQLEQLRDQLYGDQVNPPSPSLMAKEILVSHLSTLSKNMDQDDRESIQYHLEKRFDSMRIQLEGYVERIVEEKIKAIETSKETSKVESKPTQRKTAKPASEAKPKTTAKTTAKKISDNPSDKTNKPISKTTSKVTDS